MVKYNLLNIEELEKSIFGYESYSNWNDYEILKMLTPNKYLNSFIKYIKGLSVRDVIKIDNNINFSMIKKYFNWEHLTDFKNYNDVRIYYIYINWYSTIVTQYEEKNIVIEHLIYEWEKNDHYEYSTLWSIITNQGESEPKFIEYEEFKEKFLGSVMNK